MIATFTLKFTDRGTETGQVFKVYETKRHGWKDKSAFLKSIKIRTSNRKIDNGYEYLRCEGTVLTTVEAI